MGSFSATVDPTTGTPGDFTYKDATGKTVPQVSCPAGTKINIIGAFYNVVDPYNECAASITQVNPQLAFMCDPSVSGSSTCSSDADCPYSSSLLGTTSPFQCVKAAGASSGFCKLRDIGETGTCPTGQTPPLSKVTFGSGAASKTYCMNKDMCGLNIKNPLPNGLGVPNPVCSPIAGGQCAIRDASASVALRCDGREACPDLSYLDFGDAPCLNTPFQKCIASYGPDGTPVWATPGSRTGYCALPFVPGYPGGRPSGTTGDIPPPSSNIGYSMHGIFTCV